MKVAPSKPEDGRSGLTRAYNKKRYARGVLVALMALLSAGCADERVRHEIPSVLDPQGPAAESIAQLWWIMLGLGVLVLALVGGLLLYIAVAGGRRSAESEEGLIDEDSGRRWLLWGGVLLPAVILPIVFFFNLQSLARLSGTPGTETLTIEVTGHRWWWEVRYAEEQIVTANEIHIPVGQPVQLVLHSSDVIHSFWVPQLHGKIDMVPGETNTLRLQADEAGQYRGLCAEFCGAQHSRMQFVLVASPVEDYAAWVAQQQEPAPEPDNEVTRRGQQVFLGSACVYCHTVRGTNATGDLGPDLTHLGSRRTLAAGTLPNTRGHLAGWIVDPQNIKPGNLMPPTPLPAEDLLPLLEYLDTLD